jgi:hypothetical protein
MTAITALVTTFAVDMTITKTQWIAIMIQVRGWLLILGASLMAIDVRVDGHTIQAGHWY